MLKKLKMDIELIEELFNDPEENLLEVNQLVYSIVHGYPDDYENLELNEPRDKLITSEELKKELGL
jgi:hypothetical protein